MHLSGSQPGSRHAPIFSEIPLAGSHVTISLFVFLKWKIQALSAAAPSPPRPFLSAHCHAHVPPPPRSTTPSLLCVPAVVDREEATDNGGSVISPLFVFHDIVPPYVARPQLVDI